MSEQLRVDDYMPDRAMVIVAHPDDIEFGCAGTLAGWIQAGAEVSYVLCTSGDAGIDDPSITRSEATVVREAEQRAAAAVVGATDVVFLQEPDGILENTLSLRKKLVREIRRFKPDAVITFDPTVVWAGDQYINHPDHRAAAMAALDAAFPAAGQWHVFEDLADEGLEPHKVSRVYALAFGPDAANTIIDISASMDLKLDALRAHTSQMGDWDPGDMIREWATGAAEGHPFEYGETFKVVDLSGHGAAPTNQPESDPRP